MSLAIRLNDNHELDLALDAMGGLALGDDLTTAVLLSLLTDRQADLDDPLPEKNAPFPDRRGWWGDHFSPYPCGSKYWLRVRDLPNDQLRLTIITDTREALNPLMRGGVCRDAVITADFTKPDQSQPNLVMLAIHIRLLKQNGDEAKFDYVWKNK